MFPGFFCEFGVLSLDTDVLFLTFAAVVVFFLAVVSIIIVVFVSAAKIAIISELAKLSAEIFLSRRVAVFFLFLLAQRRSGRRASAEDFSLCAFRRFSFSSLFLLRPKADPLNP